tara:strand:- start:304 stop:1500 length:1197 start_codon:yes stop_codon:yes gene_type:complete
MADIPIWPGSSSFGLVSNPTPFAFYDDDAEFRADADKVSVWCAQRLGYPLIDVELQEVNFFSCFEEAVTEYGAQVYNFQIKDNIGKLRGSPTGSTLNQINIKDDFSTNFDVQGSYDAGGYSSEKRIYSASLDVKKNQQKYDLLTNGGVNFESGSSGIAAGDVEIRIKKIYHYAPSAINRYFDPYAGTGTGIQSLMQTFGMGNYSPGVNFMLMPIYFDTLKLQAIELNDQIRKSGYHYEINSERYLRLFPIPTADYKLWFEYTINNTSTGGSVNPTTGEAAKTNTITDISNVPYDIPTYSYINEPGRQWIRRYTLALAKEMLGSVRGKYQSVPIPGSETTLDYSRLLSEAQAEKDALIQTLREDLEGVTTQAQIQRTTDENNARQEGLSAEGRYQIYIH